MDRKNNKGQYVPITVRQLEALIRISESLAKMCLCNEVNESHVSLAHELFKKSTLNFASFDNSRSENNEDIKTLIEKIEEYIVKRMAVGVKVSSQKLIDELQLKFQSNFMAVNLAVTNLIKKGDLVKENNGKVLTRRV
mmetsp:Transcript_14167/g.30679  ORF Transcript_14167/g.30679 Transcript_14167/m.30679 type:complete len:138 (+) Transcript_14167:1767-2180(+)